MSAPYESTGREALEALLEELQTFKAEHERKVAAYRDAGKHTAATTGELILEGIRRTIREVQQFTGGSGA